MEALSKGDYGDHIDFALDASQEVRKVGDTYGQDFLVLGRFEICDVQFERKLYFFND